MQCYLFFFRYFDACGEINQKLGTTLDLGDGLRPIDFKVCILFCQYIFTIFFIGKFHIVFFLHLKGWINYISCNVIWCCNNTATLFGYYKSTWWKLAQKSWQRNWTTETIRRIIQVNKYDWFIKQRILSRKIYYIKFQKIQRSTWKITKIFISWSRSWGKLF